MDLVRVTLHGEGGEVLACFVATSLYAEAWTQMREAEGFTVTAISLTSSEQEALV